MSGAVASTKEKPLRVLSVCSGIGAAELGFGRAGMEIVACADIEGFPNAVREIRFPGVPNLGDMTKFHDWPRWGEHLGGPHGSAIDVVVGGTPCQSFSIAGLRAGLDDPRGNLALVFLGLVERYRPGWVVWENVPGVRSSWLHDAPDPVQPPDDMAEGSEWVGEDEYDADETSAFGCFVAGLVELGYGVGWRSPDAQYFGLAQRRERVFVVGHRGDRRCAAAVLLEPESLRRTDPPRREAGEAVAGAVTGSTGDASPRGDGSDTLILQDVAPTLPARSTAGGGLGTDFDLDGGLVVGGFGDGVVAGTVTAKWAKGSGGPAWDECANLVAFSACDDGRDVTVDQAPTLRVGSGQRAGGGQQMAVAYDIRGRESGAQIEGPSDTAALRAASGGSSRSVLAIQDRAGAEGGHGPGGKGWREDGVAYTLEARTVPQAVAVAEHQDGGIRERDVAGTLNKGGGGSIGQGYAAVRQGMVVRRIMPLEAERLQGFPDNWTAIPWRGRPAEACPDGPRFRALGNSMAVPVMEWIGRRIVLCDQVWREIHGDDAAAVPDADAGA